MLLARLLIRTRMMLTWQSSWPEALVVQYVVGACVFQTPWSFPCASQPNDCSLPLQSQMLTNMEQRVPLSSFLTRLTSGWMERSAPPPGAKRQGTASTAGRPGTGRRGSYASLRLMSGTAATASGGGSGSGSGSGAGSAADGGPSPARATPRPRATANTFMPTTPERRAPSATGSRPRTSRPRPNGAAAATAESPGTDKLVQQRRALHTAPTDSSLATAAGSRRRSVGRGGRPADNRHSAEVDVLLAKSRRQALS